MPPARIPIHAPRQCPRLRRRVARVPMRVCACAAARLCAAAMLCTATMLCMTTSGTLRAESSAGFELDALPYATGGYYGSAWIGDGPLRYRAVVARIYPPDFAVNSGFNHLRIDAQALIVDYFFGADAARWNGPWIGAGLEQWDSRVQEQGTGASASFSNTIATAGGGYVWRFLGNFYLNPWAALHFITDGKRSVPVGSQTYVPQDVTPEASLKIGWNF